MNKNVIFNIALIILIVIFTSVFSIGMKEFYESFAGDKDYEKTGLSIKKYNIDYYTVYNDSGLGKYKVYKIGINSVKDIIKQIENNSEWSKNKFYEYIMESFKIPNKEDDYDDIIKNDLYFSNLNGAYMIFDTKNRELHYLTRGLFLYDESDSSKLGIEMNDYINKEVYSVRGGPQMDGEDYYIYEFSKEKGKQIEEYLKNSNEWKNERISGDKLNFFSENEEVYEIKNGYYYFKLINRTSDDYKRKHFTEEEATGFEQAIYDIDSNRFYYLWISG